ncbi:MAG TPA: 50S ribosomal protein L30 [Nitrososphaerales archaeon]|nr:50S ribosomal protein L30 [Nitrososphaerales archaeon]
MRVSLFLVVNLHGLINSSGPVRKALNELKVERKFSASVVSDDDTTVGMLRLCKDRIAWAPVEADLLSTLLKQKGMISGAKSLDSAALKGMGYKTHEELAQAMIKGNLRLSKVAGVRPFFRLAPPKGGFKRSMRKQYTEKGILGRNPKLEEIVRRML